MEQSLVTLFNDDERCDQADERSGRMIIACCVFCWSGDYRVFNYLLLLLIMMMMNDGVLAMGLTNGDHGGMHVCTITKRCWSS